VIRINQKKQSTISKTKDKSKPSLKFRSILMIGLNIGLNDDKEHL